MKKISRWLCLIVSVAMFIFLIAGCAQASTSTTTAAPASTTTPGSAASTAPVNTTVAAGWKPTRPVSIYIYAGPGGDTDTACRALASYWQEYFGTPFNVVNMTGGGGGIAANHVYNQPSDGHTLFGMAEGVNSLNVLGAFDKKTDVWEIMLLFSGKGSISVPIDSPYNTIQDLVEASKTKNINISLSGTGIWLAKGLQFKDAFMPGQITLLPYDGSNQAIIGLLSKESDAVISSLGEQSEYILGKKLKPLAILENSDGTLEGFGDVPSIVKTYPVWNELPAAIQWNGIGLKADMPQEIKDAYEKAFLAALKSKQIETVRVTRRTNILGKVGNEARKIIQEQDSTVCWLLYDKGVTKVSPEQYDIPRP